MKIPTSHHLSKLYSAILQQDPTDVAEFTDAAAYAATNCLMEGRHLLPKVIVFAGPGNNGAIGLSIARILCKKGISTHTYLFNPNGNLSAATAFQRACLESLPDVPITDITAQFEAPALSADTLVIDALFGTGLNRPLSGGFASLVKFINNSPAQVAAIDMPSGLMAEDNTGNVHAHIVKAKITLTFLFPKLSLLLADCQKYVGELRVLSIDAAQKYVNASEASIFLSEEKDIASLLRIRPTYGHKGDFGNVLLIAGRYGMAGASILAARSCLRSGIGKVTVHIPTKNNDIVQQAVPEALVTHDSNATHFTEPEQTATYNALGIGPAIGQETATALAFIEQIRKATCPLVIDADGLNILAQHRGWMNQIPPNSILTPHAGEMQRLSSSNGISGSYALLEEAQEMATTLRVYIILKGHYTAICSPDGCLWLNPTGNQGMATAGSGDVLTGLLTALLAQHYPPLDACRLGVYLHGLAGDLAAKELGEDSLIASDLIDHLPYAFKTLRRNYSLSKNQE